MTCLAHPARERRSWGHAQGSRLLSTNLPSHLQLFIEDSLCKILSQIENNHGENLPENKITMQYFSDIFSMSENSRDSHVAIRVYCIHTDTRSHAHKITKGLFSVLIYLDQALGSCYFPLFAICLQYALGKG